MVVDSVVDLICGLEAFAFNSVDCVFDRVKIVEGGVSASETQVGGSECFWVKAVYGYSGEPFTGVDGLLFVNGEKMVWSSHDMVWEFDWVREELGSMVFEVSGVYGSAIWVDSHE